MEKKNRKSLSSEAVGYLKDLEPTIKDSRIVIAEVGINQKIRWIINQNPKLGNHLAGKKFSDVFIQEDSRKIREIAKKIIKGEKGIRSILRFKIKGEDYYYDIIVEPLFKYKVLDGILCIAIDITDIVKTKKALARASDKLISMLGDVPENL